MCVWWVKARDCQLNNHRFKSHELTGESFFPNLAFYPGPSKKLNQVPGLGWRSRRPQIEVLVGLWLPTAQLKGHSEC